MTRAERPPTASSPAASSRSTDSASRRPDARRPDARRPTATYLTARQKEILEFIAGYQQREGISPTHREIRDEFGYSSFGTVYKHLKLLQEKGYLHRDWNQKRGLELLRTVTTPQMTSESEVPFLGLIAAGQPIEALPGPEQLVVPHHLFDGSPANHYVLRVSGESMIDEGIHDGDYVIVQRREQARAGEMVVALIDGDATLKRFFPEGDIIRLQPAHPDMDPIRVPASSVKVQGVVVGLMRKF
ncbi:MAG: transcriptional repressor LexA [Acidobacteriota bacterium]